MATITEISLTTCQALNIVEVKKQSGVENRYQKEEDYVILKKQMNSSIDEQVTVVVKNHVVNSLLYEDINFKRKSYLTKLNIKFTIGFEIFLSYNPDCQWDLRSCNDEKNSQVIDEFDLLKLPLIIETFYFVKV